MESSWVLNETLSTQFNHFANTVFNSFLDLIDKRLKTGDSKYGKLMRFFLRYSNRESVVLFSGEYTLLGEDIKVFFIIEKTDGGLVEGGYDEKVIHINISPEIFSEIKDSIKPLSFLQRVVELIKSTIVHEVTHFYQDIRYDAFNSEKTDLLYGTDFNLTYSSKIYSYIYFTRSEEISAYMSEAYRFFKKYRRSLEVNYLDCLSAALNNRENCTVNDMLERGFSLDELLESYLQEEKYLPNYFAILYILYVFLPQTRFFYLVEDNEAYKKNKPDDVNEDVANKNRYRIIKLMYDTSELKKKRQMESAIKELVKNKTFYKLFSLSKSNARLVNKLRQDVLGE